MPQATSEMPPVRIFRSINPATGETVWEGAEDWDVDGAVTLARKAANAWAATALDHRIEILQQFALRLKDDRAGMAEIISTEVGKPHWEALTEVDAMINKIPVSIQACNDRRTPSSSEVGGVRSATRFKPHGVVVVLGPFNFPGHLPNGHIVPALLAGNAVLFKPSELAPAVAERTVDHWYQAGLPVDVLQMLRGDGQMGALLSSIRELTAFSSPAVRKSVSACDKPSRPIRKKSSHWKWVVTTRWWFTKPVIFPLRFTTQSNPPSSPPPSAAPARGG